MDGADNLCELLFGWLAKREQCAEKLLEIVQEFENVDQSSKTSQGAGATTPKVFIPTLATTAKRVAVELGTITNILPVKLVDTGVSSSTFITAIDLIKEDEKIGRSIQQQLQDLRKRCREEQLGAHSDDDDDEECEVATLIMWALARRIKTILPLNFLRSFNRATFFRQASSGGLPLAEASQYICRALGFAGLGAGERQEFSKSGLKVSAKEMVEDIGTIGVRAAAEAGSRAQGLGMSLSDLIPVCEEIVKGNRVTEANKFLRDSAKEILEGRRKLKEQLDAMHEILRKLLQLKNLVKDLGGFSLSLTENAQAIMYFIIGTCTDNSVYTWLRQYQAEFVNLLRVYGERLNDIFGGHSVGQGRHINIVFVAHGGITAELMPAGGLASAPTIRDTVLYSPWNCSIDGSAAYSIAQGSIRTGDRIFSNMFNCEPNPLPNHWNFMRASQHNIPKINLYPLVPGEPAWKCFQELMGLRFMNMEDRVIIPYLVPQYLVNAFGEIPFYIIVFALSFMLMLYGCTATVHLAACLDRGDSMPMPVEWRTQYAYTYDGTVMSAKLDETNVNTALLEAFRALFG